MLKIGNIPAESTDLCKYLGGRVTPGRGSVPRRCRAGRAGPAYACRCEAAAEGNPECGADAVPHAEARPRQLPVPRPRARCRGGSEAAASHAGFTTRGEAAGQSVVSVVHGYCEYRRNQASSDMTSKRLFFASLLLRCWFVEGEMYLPALFSSSGSTPATKRVDYNLYNHEYHDERGTKCSGCKYVPQIHRYYPEARVILDAGAGNCKVMHILPTGSVVHLSHLS
eukprot:1149059-Pyramimonas_sp.AAC.4